MKTKQSSTPKKNQGFTLVEMLVVAPILILMIGAFIAMVISLTGEALRSRLTDGMTYSIQDALSQIQTDVELSTAFLAENDISLATSGQGYGDTATTNSTVNFNNIDTGHNAIILKLVATTENRNSPTAVPVYEANAPNTCSNPALYVSNTPMYVNIVYFVENNTLWRRVIMPSNYATGSAYCGTTWQRPTCTPSYIAASRTFCKAADTALISAPDGIEVSIGYYASPESTTLVGAATNSANSTAVRNTSLQGTKTVETALSITQDISGETLQRNGEIRATRLE